MKRRKFTDEQIILALLHSAVYAHGMPIRVIVTQGITADCTYRQAS